MHIQIPFGKTHFQLNFDGSVLEPESHHYQSEGTEGQLVVCALETPIGTPRLCDLAEDKKRVLVITSDHTRPVPSKKDSASFAGRTEKKEFGRRGKNIDRYRIPPPHLKGGNAG